MRDLRSRLCCALAQLTRLAGVAVLAAFAWLAAAPAPSPSAVRTPPDITKVQPKILLPKTALHSAYVVAVNKYGQVTYIVSGQPSRNKIYDLQTYGNALQAFIRTPEGKAISGTYRLTYDYNPKTERIRRDVEILKEGGVDPNLKGAALLMIEDVRKRAKRPPGQTVKTPAP